MKYSKYISLISGTGDLIIMNICFNFAYWYFLDFQLDKLSVNAILFFFYINSAWLISANIFEAYKIEHHSYKKVILFNNIKTVILFFFAFLLFFQFFTFNYYSRDQVKYLFVFYFSILIIWKFLLYYSFLYYRKLGYNYRNVIIVGYNEMAVELSNYFTNNPWTGYRFKGFVTKESKNTNLSVVNLENFVKNQGIDEIYIMTNMLDPEIISKVNDISGRLPLAVRIVPDLTNSPDRNFELVKYDTIPILKLREGPLDFWLNRAYKRSVDIVSSILVISFVLSWLIPLLFIIDLLTDREGVFFIQKRSGLDNKVFKVIKFRSMRKNKLAHLQQATKNDYRITKFGSFLRKTSIDEIPQFFNVLMGDMSFIGPRPHMLKHTEEYSSMVQKFMIRHKIKPGITGYAQVRGYRGEITSHKDIENRVKMDMYYIKNWSAWLDIKILFLTVLSVIKGDSNAY